MNPTSVVRPAEVDEVTAILAALDEVLASRARLKALGVGSPDASISFIASSYPQAEYALRLWTSAHAEEHKLELRESISRYDVEPYNRPEQIRSISICAVRGDRIAWVQWDPEPIPAIPACPVCTRPAHASETDDLDRHPECQDGDPPTPEDLNALTAEDDARAEAEAELDRRDAEYPCDDRLNAPPLGVF